MFGFTSETRRQESQRKERQEQLRKLLLTQTPNEKGRSSDYSKKAIAYCEYCISEYEEWFEFNEGRWITWQKIAIIAGVVATLVATISFPRAWIPDEFEPYWGIVRAIPAAAATIATGFLSSFMYKEDAVRHELTSNALWNELAKFLVHAKPYNDKDGEEVDVRVFTSTICRLVETEVNSWGALVRGQRDGASDNNKGDVHSDPDKPIEDKDKATPPPTPPGP
ncbi:MAG: DUF4231 domain-containing protein [Xanthobacteraceae bacterium]|nr:DUF4231 domain-containing protein [Xanthobacteraceae bacterium]